MDKRSTNCVEWVEKIIRDGVNLTAWEEDFAESMQARVEQYGDRVVFTDKQAEVIERIYTNRVP